MNKGYDQSSELVAPASGANVLSDVLGAVRLTGSMLFHVEAATPWVTGAPRSEAFRPVVLPGSQHLISYHIVPQGAAGPASAASRRSASRPAECSSCRRATPTFSPTTPHAEQTYGADEAVDFFRCMAAGELSSAVNADGDGAERTRFICAFLGCNVRQFNPALAALPRTLHLRAPPEPAADRMSHLFALAVAEMRENSSGRREILMRLSGLMFVEAVRRHFGTVVDSQTGWLAGLMSPVVARALALLHAEPAQDWTLDALAERVGASRRAICRPSANPILDAVAHAACFAIAR